MARTAPTVEEIISDFSHPMVPKVSGEPTYESIHRIHKLLQENAVSMQSDLGGEAHGHLALVLTPGHYQQVTGHIFVAPAYPGPNPPTARHFMLKQELQSHRDQSFNELYRFSI
eukprot:5197096-Ditylum_brightwellii.AAC.1